MVSSGNNTVHVIVRNRPSFVSSRARRALATEPRAEKLGIILGEEGTSAKSASQTAATQSEQAGTRRHDR
jgi:hypothetical protein